MLLSLLAAATVLLPEPTPRSPEHSSPIAVTTAVPTRGVLRLVEVRLSPGEVPGLQRLGLDIVHLDLALGRAQVVADDTGIRALAQAGLTYTIRVEDIEAWYAARLASSGAPALNPVYGAWLVPMFAQGSLGGYYSYDEVSSVLEQMAAQYPAFVAPRVSLGKSVEGRDIWMLKVSDNPLVDEAEPEVRIDALHHAREPGSMQAALWFVLYLLEEYGQDPLATYIVDERETYVVPVVNPDGYVYNQQVLPGGGGMWRKNRRANGNGTYGVDLNRNYPYQWGFDDLGSSSTLTSETYRGPAPGSEPETQAMVHFIRSREFRTALSLHTFGDLWLSTWGYDELMPSSPERRAEVAGLATEVNGYPNGPIWQLLYVENGVTVDYDHWFGGTFAWTPEIGGLTDGFWPVSARIEPLAVECQLAFQRTALAAGAWVRWIDEQRSDLGDGDGHFEAGERIGFRPRVRNSGRGAPRTAVRFQLATASPWASVIQATSSAGIVPPFQDSEPGTSMRLGIDPATPSGATIAYTIEMTYAGLVLEFPGTIVVGQPLPIARFDFESGEDQEWAVGLPNDATSGSWVRVDPNGTRAQPEDDHTPNGRVCWVTGQGSPGGPLGEDDVDGGTTSLWTPTLNLAGLADPELRFWLWYSNDAGSNPGADTFHVDVSGDDGASWTPALSIGPTGPGTSGGWVSYSIHLAEHVPTTETMRARFRASDLGSGSIVEAALDDVVVAGIPVPCSPPMNYCTAATNSTGDTARMAWSGTQQVSANAFTLEVSGAPPGQLGLFLYGPTIGSASIANGLLCVGGQIYRLPPGPCDASGAFAYTLDFPQPPSPAAEIVAGSTWFFQHWHRDTGVGAGSNFSDGLRVTFCN